MSFTGEENTEIPIMRSARSRSYNRQARVGMKGNTAPVPFGTRAQQSKTQYQPMGFFTAPPQQSPSANPTERLKGWKRELHNLSSSYNETMVRVQQLQREVDKSNLKSQKIKVTFMRAFDYHRMKKTLRDLAETHQVYSQEHQNECINKAKQQRFHEQAAKILQRTQQECELEERIRRNRDHKLDFKSQLNSVNEKYISHARSCYGKQREQEQRLQERIRKIQSMQSARAKQNYMARLNQQLCYFDQYSQLFKELEGDQTPQNRPVSTSKGAFFLTERTSAGFTQ